MIWDNNWREETWARIPQDHWDVIVVGGGITGAGILREAARCRLRVLLVEMKDFAWGTSSRSSKMVHGGLRYLATGQLGLTMESVREREQLLEDGPGLIDPLGFLIATHKGDRPGKFTYGAGLAMYDLMALQWSHRFYPPDDFRMLAPHLKTADLQGGFRYGDAQTDDARLVMRVIQEAVDDGGMAINYVKAEKLLHDADGQVIGVELRDAETGETVAVRARAVVNATGAWADTLRQQVGGQVRMRPLRGSHLVFPSWRLPVAQAITFLHPFDRRPVFICPWEGVTLVGTTDIDHNDSLYEEPGISPEETAYLMAAAADQFPTLNLTLDDVIATWAGVRPVVGSGKDDPSKESRDYVLWREDGLMTVTGGKLTTFRAVAHAALRQLQDKLPDLRALDRRQPVLDPVDVRLPADISEPVRRRLLGRFGAHAEAVVRAAEPGELTIIPGTLTLWAELRWAARAEGVVHLEDLLLRRTRLGLLLAAGGLDQAERIRAICQPELGWDDTRWEAEEAAYRDLWVEAYALPPRHLVPDWRANLAEARARREAAIRAEAPRVRPWLIPVAILGALLLWWWLFRRLAAQDDA
ncbi:MAG: glycerol-3-phosphate dehydrogenase/oxidase [Chloroflexota bacterium]